MGDCSYFSYEDIVVNNAEALIKLRNSDDFDGCELISDDGKISFEHWDGHKLEGYWYEETIKNLKLVAPYIEGEAVFSFENSYDFKLEFYNGQVFFRREEKEWSASRQEL